MKAAVQAAEVNGGWITKLGRRLCATDTCDMPIAYADLFFIEFGIKCNLLNSPLIKILSIKDLSDHKDRWYRTLEAAKISCNVMLFSLTKDSLAIT
jgi:hypothetical protein